jgi:hypothetical protein
MVCGYGRGVLLFNPFSCSGRFQLSGGDNVGGCISLDLGAKLSSSAKRMGWKQEE